MIAYCIIITLVVRFSAAKSNLERIPNEICTFSIDGHIYDLSKLAKKDNWKYSEEFHTEHYYVSVCHPIKNLEGCENNNVCFMSQDNTNKSSITFRSGGKSKENSIPTFMSDGHLQFVFTNGSVCNKQKFDKLTNYTTELYLQCPLKGDEDSYGPVLMSSTTCKLIFFWITTAACPRKYKVEKNSCLINFNDTKSIDLSSLRAKTFYHVKDNISLFEINFCGPIINGSCMGNNVSICDLSDQNNPTPIAFFDHTNLDWNYEKRNLDMFFKKENMISKIIFECDRTLKEKPEISFINKVYSNGSSGFEFEMKTSLVCLSIKSDCVLYDFNNNVIDLRPLRKNGSNWEVFVQMDGDETPKMQQYLLNVCGPLNNRKHIGCSEGYIGACKASITDGGDLNLGYVTSSPIISKDGSISILYTGGDPCKIDVQSSSTKIILYCNKVEHLPVLVTVTASCLHIFEWHTPTACPMKEIIGKDCKVTDPLHGEVFDLNPLRNTYNDYNVTAGSNYFLINICGPLLSKCDGDNSSICSVGHETKSGGKAPGSLIFDDGTLVMVFEDGAKCNDGKWSTKILIICNHVAMENIPEFFKTNNDTCTHVFIWHTFYACPSFTSVDCFIQDRNNWYDLTQLSEPMDNWEFVNSANNGGNPKKYIFNVCRSVVHSKEYRCPYKSGACSIDSSQGSNHGRGLGNVLSSPYIKNGSVMIHYTGGDFCTNRKRYETLIIFECVPWNYNSVPILEKEDNCQIVIKVPTNYACPRKVHPSIEQITGNCSVSNTFTNYVYDLSSLRDKSFKVSYGNNVSILLNICGNSTGKECSGSGSCWLQKKINENKTLNMGVANSNLKFSNWTVFLEYKDGDSCISKLYGKIQQRTKISFVCSESKHIHGPVIIDYDANSCILYVNWHTDLVCEQKINCFAGKHNGETFNLAPFAKFYGNYKVIDPYSLTTTYYINICKPLNPMIGVRCQPGSSACMVVENINNTKVMSNLGHALIDPIVNSNGHVELMYSHGSSCTKKGLSSSSMTSRITFICRKNFGVGAPVFIEQTHDCQVKFEWQTALVCPNNSEDNTHYGKQCQIYLEEAKANIDIMPLYKPDGYTVQHGNVTFKVNVCGPVCDNSGVCTTNGTSYGHVAHVNLLWESDMLKLVYYTGDPCKTSLTLSRSSMIYFECDMQAGHGVPVAEPWNKEDSCIMVFSWRTNATCIEAIYKPNEVTSTTINTPIVTDQIKPKSDFYTSGNIGLSILIAASVGTLVLVTSAVLFFRSIQGRRITTQARGFFRRKGDEVFILDDQHLQDI